MAATRTHMLSKHFKTMKTMMRQTKLPLKIWISMLNNSKSKRWPYREWAIWKSSSNISTHYRKCTRKMRSPEKVEDNKELSCQDSRIKPSDPPKTTFTNSINKAWTKFAPKPYKMINRRIWILIRASTPPCCSWTINVIVWIVRRRWRGTGSTICRLATRHIHSWRIRSRIRCRRHRLHGSISSL